MRPESLALLGLIAVAAACTAAQEPPAKGLAPGVDARDAATDGDSRGAVGVPPLDEGIGSGDARAGDVAGAADDAGGVADALALDSDAPAPDARAVGDGGVAPDGSFDEVVEDLMADPSDAASQEAGSADTQFAGPDVVDFVDYADCGAWEIDGTPASSVASAAEILGSLPDLPGPVVSGFQGGFYGCASPPDLPEQEEVLEPCYDATGYIGKEPLWEGYTKYGYDCDRRLVYTISFHYGNPDPWLVTHQTWTADGKLDEYVQDALDVPTTSYTMKHQYDEAGRLTKIVYSYPNGTKSPVAKAREEYSYDESGLLAVKEHYGYQFYVSPVETLDKREQYTYSVGGNLVRRDIYDGKGNLEHRTKSQWACDKLVYYEVDWGTDCDWGDMGPAPYCPEQGADGTPEYLCNLFYDAAGTRIRTETFSIFPGFLYPWNIDINVYGTGGRLLARLMYLHPEEAEEGNVWQAYMYDYDEHGRKRQEVMWNKNEVGGWTQLHRTSYDCWQ